MSGHPPPNIKPKGSIGRLKNAFLYGTPLSEPSHNAVTQHEDHAVYKGDVLFGRMKERYPGCRRYDLTQDGDLASAKAMQNLWTRGAVRDGSSHHDPRWGVGGAERAEIFVRSSAEGHKEIILPAIPIRVTWRAGPQNPDLRGWAACSSAFKGPQHFLPCPADLIRLQSDATVFTNQFIKQWRAGDQTPRGSRYGLQIQVGDVSYDWQYFLYRNDVSPVDGSTIPPAISTWTCQNTSSRVLETYLFDLELTRKIEELEGQHAHIPVSRAGAA